MNCPPTIARVVLEIIRQATLRARAAGWAGDARRAALEADHVHNLPELLMNYSPDLLRYYWNVQRAGYLSQAQRTGLWTQDFDSLWEQLRTVLENPRESALAK